MPDLLERTRSVLAASETGPAKPSIAYQRMATGIKLVDDLCGGTERMREAGTDWLPQKPKEKDPHYVTRRDSSFLHPMLGDTVDKLVGAPFSRPVTVYVPDEGMVLPEKLAALEDNADADGKDLTQFAKRVFRGGVKHGLRFIFVDYSGPGGTTVEDDEQGNVRPYFVDIKASDFLGFEFEEDAFGVPQLSEVRFREVREDSTGSTETANRWEKEVVEYMRVIGRGTWELYRRTKEQGSAAFVWKKVGEAGTYRMAGAPDPDRPPIPLVCYYTNETGTFQAIPPLIGLAWLNVAHWQSYSDHRAHLQFIRTGIMYMAGATDEERTEYENLTVGPNKLVFLSRSDAKVAHASYQGTATEASRLDLKDIEDRGEILGLQPLVEKGVSSTATRAMDERSQKSAAIKQWTRDMGKVLVEAYRYAAMWANEELPEGFDVRVFSEFSIAFRSESELQELLKARVAGEISRETYLREIQRRGLISTDIDVSDEMDALEQESEVAFEKQQELAKGFGGKEDEGVIPGDGGDDTGDGGTE